MPKKAGTEACQTEYFNGVVDRAERLNKENPELQYHAAWSNECIEFWFLLHLYTIRQIIIDQSIVHS